MRLLLAVRGLASPRRWLTPVDRWRCFVQYAAARPMRPCLPTHFCLTADGRVDSWSHVATYLSKDRVVRLFKRLLNAQALLASSLPLALWIAHEGQSEGVTTGRECLRYERAHATPLGLFTWQRLNIDYVNCPNCTSLLGCAL
jgi:hypothetical protein